MSIDNLTTEEREHICYEIQVEHFAEKASDLESAVVLLILQHLAHVKLDDPSEVSDLISAAAAQVKELHETMKQYKKTTASLLHEYGEAVVKNRHKKDEYPVPDGTT
jgi:hypothetical protein